MSHRQPVYKMMWWKRLDQNHVSVHGSDCEGSCQNKQLNGVQRLGELTARCVCCVLITAGLCWAQRNLQPAAFRTEVCRDPPELPGQSVWQWLEVQHTLRMTPARTRTGTGWCFLWSSPLSDYCGWILSSCHVTCCNLIQLSCIDPTFMMVLVFRFDLDLFKREVMLRGCSCCCCYSMLHHTERRL